MKYPFILIGLFWIINLPITGQVPDSLKFISLPPHDFHQAYLNEEKALLIDVREFFEFSKNRLKGAVNIPSMGNLEVASDTIDKQYALFLYCTSGIRSKKVAKYFYDKGFSRPYSLEGGIIAWRKESMAVDKKRVRKH